MKNSAPTVYYSTAKEYDEFAAQLLFNKFEKLQRLNRKICIALSGGSTPLPILSKVAQRNIDWSKFFFFLVDERIVSIESPMSNFGNIKQAFFNNISSKYFSMISKDISLDESIENYLNQINNNVNKYNGYPSFDLMVLGMGNDGHVASLFPQSTALKETQKYVTVADSHESKNNRITLTFPVINSSKDIVILIKGEEKLNVFNTLYKNPIGKEPIRIIIENVNNITWLIEKNQDA